VMKGFSNNPAVQQQMDGDTKSGGRDGAN